MKIIYEPMGELEGTWEDLVPVTDGLPEIAVCTAEYWIADGEPSVPVEGSLERDEVLHIIINEPALTPELVAEALSKYFRVAVSDVIFSS